MWTSGRTFHAPNTHTKLRSLPPSLALVLVQVIMVENSWDVIRYHLENGVHISSFYGDREDTELLSTLESLKSLAPADDVRDGIIR